MQASQCGIEEEAPYDSIIYRHRALIKHIARLCRIPHLLLPSNKLTMPLIGTSFFILGLVVASAIADETTIRGLPTDSTAFVNQIPTSNDNTQTTVIPPISTNTTSITTNVTSTSANNINISNTTATDSPTKSLTTPKAIDPKSSTSASSINSNTTKENLALRETSGNTGIIILIVIILVSFGCLVACYLARRRGRVSRRYSVDFSSRPDETNIPLSTVQPELTGDTVSQNGLKTFESTETTAKEPQEPEAKPEGQEEQETEADKFLADPSAESAASTPSTDNSEDKPKDDRQSLLAPVQPSMEEKTDDEGTASNKTSVESLKDANENNSNNGDFSQKRDHELSSVFWDVPLNCPV
ncbi:bromodomain-containing protein DDB_G0270170 isoform X3 [Xiphias gladius]|uniref:bromodomain-containing protein DDB_G0270170 isoform X3 n=1 Tax=Xiphias gladius TaxID=8245 RepID=UPI001A99CEEB|nr:bromodomain-containing protein DDB_G0270170 isoform X3 [Xiphias gladius]